MCLKDLHRCKVCGLIDFGDDHPCGDLACEGARGKLVNEGYICDDHVKGKDQGGLVTVGTVESGGRCSGEKPASESSQPQPEGHGHQQEREKESGTDTNRDTSKQLDEAGLEGSSMKEQKNVYSSEDDSSDDDYCDDDSSDYDSEDEESDDGEFEDDVDKQREAELMQIEYIPVPTIPTKPPITEQVNTLATSLTTWHNTSLSSTEQGERAPPEALLPAEGRPTAPGICGNPTQAPPYPKMAAYGPERKMLIETTNLKQPQHHDDQSADEDTDAEGDVRMGGMGDEPWVRRPWSSQRHSRVFKMPKPQNIAEQRQAERGFQGQGSRCRQSFWKLNRIKGMVRAL